VLEADMRPDDRPTQGDALPEGTRPSESSVAAVEPVDIQDESTLDEISIPMPASTVASTTEVLAVEIVSESASVADAVGEVNIPMAQPPDELSEDEPFGAGLDTGLSSAVSHVDAQIPADIGPAPTANAEPESSSSESDPDRKKGKRPNRRRRSRRGPKKNDGPPPAGNS